MAIAGPFAASTAGPRRYNVAMNNRQFLAAAISALCITAGFNTTGYAQQSELSAKKSTVGIAAEAPAEGRSVKCEQGFMVPYTQKLHGTNAKFEMVPIPGGEFKIGSPESEAKRGKDEGPQVTIKVAPFWMGKYEVRWSEYRSFMQLYDLFKKLESKKLRTVTEKNQADAITIPTPLYDPSYTYALGEEPEQPAVTMSQYAAKQYTKWASRLTGDFYRLPTEAEWEYACRAGTTTAYSFGDDPAAIGDYAWFFDNSDDVTYPVGKKKPNAWGLFDMHGNVSELVLDQYAADRYANLPESDAKSVGSIAWGKKIFGRVIRGGSWQDDAELLRSAARSQTDDWRNEDPNLPKSPWWFTDEDALTVGFRIIRPLTPPAAGERNKYWDPDATKITIAVDNRIAEGRGIYGLVDEDLPADLEKVK